MELSLNQIVLTIIVASFGLVAFFAIVSRLLHHRTEARLARLRIVCRLCGRVFVAKHHGKLSHCESCGALNLHQGNDRLG